ncbi:MAG TPA: hypothetical protein VMZ02_05720 [Candidatus Limnocylindrales bacterium]|nr:hypothetical protein [Candidatus Limnocylindrales bacterium]
MKASLPDVYCLVRHTGGCRYPGLFLSLSHYPAWMPVFTGMSE